MITPKTKNVGQVNTIKKQNTRKKNEKLHNTRLNPSV